MRADYDDGVRVLVDGALLFYDWRWQGELASVRVPVSAGRHHIVLEYFQIDGAAALKVELVRR